MAGVEVLFNLYLRAKERYLNGCNSFEEHFSWLDEVVATARQTFASLEPSLLPKTPQVKRKTQKRPLQPSIAEEEDSPPAKRISASSTRSNNDVHSPVEVLPRRGRAASKIAQERMKKDLQNDGNRKLRRPSTPKMVATTSKKIRGSRRAVRYRDSPEGNCKHILKSPEQEEGRKLSSGTKETDVKRLTSQSQVEQVLDPKPAVDPVSSQDTPKKKRDSTIRLSVNLSRERWPYVDTSQEVTEDSQNITQIIVTNVHQEDGKDETRITENDSTDPALRLGDGSEEEKGKKVQTLEVEIKRSKERNESLSYEISAEKLGKIPVSDKENKSCLSPSMGEGVEFLLETPQKTPVPVSRGRTTCTKQRELQSLIVDDAGAHNKMLVTIDSPHPVPKPRSTRTKQKKEMHMENMANEESSTHMLPPTNIPNSRVTRTKTRAKEQDSSNEQEGSDSHLSVKQGVANCKQTDPLLLEEIPKSRSTHTKKKTIEVKNTFENSVTKEDFEGMAITESQNPGYTTPNKREAEEQTLERPARSTKMKWKKIEELSEKDLVDQEIQCLHITDSEDKKEIKSSQVEMNATFVKSDSHSTFNNVSKYNDFSTEFVSYEESSAKSTHVSALFTNARTTQNAEIVQVSRVTRSKVRHLLPVNVSPNKSSPSSHTGKNMMSPKTPVHSTFKRVCCTPNSDGESPKASALRQRGTSGKSPMKHSPRPFLRSGPGHMICSTANADQNHIREALKEVEELTSEDCEVPYSPATITRHPQGKSHRTRDFHGMLINHISQTPSPVCPLGKKIGTPNEVIRTGNIVSGITSLIKIQPAKASRKDLEEKRLIEMQRKKERMEETKKKKEELLKLKAEEQKRRNEERMRRVQEAREERERKAIEAKERQEKDRKLREERQREEHQRRKQHLLAKRRAEEEAKVRKIREQQEEERKRQEEEIRKLMEEEKRSEEAKRLEEEKVAHLAEQRRLQEEEKKRRIAEAERIARERKELEKLRLREAQRIAEGMQVKIISSETKKVALNDTYTAVDNKENSDHNSTFTKTSGSSQPNSSEKEHSNRYEKTPDLKKIKKDDASVNNYNIANIKSDDSTDDETAPKKKIPPWASTSQLKVAMINQEYYPPVVEKIFPPENLLVMPDLSRMFPIQRKRFTKRTSSAIWNTPPANFFESE